MSKSTTATAPTFAGENSVLKANIAAFLTTYADSSENSVHAGWLALSGMAKNGTIPTDIRKATESVTGLKLSANKWQGVAASVYLLSRVVDTTAGKGSKNVQAVVLAVLAGKLADEKGNAWNLGRLKNLHAEATYATIEELANVMTAWRDAEKANVKGRGARPNDGDNSDSDGGDTPASDSADAPTTGGTVTVESIATLVRSLASTSGQSVEDILADVAAILG